MTDFDLSNFLDQFFDEARQRLRSINQGLVLFESGDLDAAKLNQLRRHAHTIKGSAQMLGVKDMSEAGHLFEDAMEYMLQYPDSYTRSRPMLQFLFDLHDQLEERLQHQDREVWLDISPLKERFKTLQHDFEQQQINTVGTHEQAGTAAAESSSNHVIAEAVDVGKQSVYSTNKDDADDIQDTVEWNMDISPDDSDEFRPDILGLELDSSEQPKGSGNYLRVDRERLSQLSNQIVELSSDRYQVESMEEQFEVILHDLQQLKHDMQTFEANTHANRDAGKRAAVAGKVRIALEQQLRQTQLLGEELRHNQSRSSIMLDDLRDQVLGLMLCPLSSIFSIFPRTVRDIAIRCEKKVQLLVAGESVEMDQLVAEALVEPLVHLINNAVAHGIEKPDQRLRCGKSFEGQVTIVVRQKASKIEIDVIDDGQGIDVEQIRDLAISRGLITASEADDMGTAEILELIFHPGLTTQQTANEISGRGMGMNVVYNAVRKLTGSIHIDTQKGQGTRFTLSLPVSIAVQQARIFRIADQRFGMLANAIETILPMGSQSIEKGRGPYDKGFIDYKKHRVPIIDLRQTLRQSPGFDRRFRDVHVLIVEHIEGYLGIVVDELFDQVEVIVRELDPYLSHYQPVGVVGNTIIADGSVLLLIEPDGIKEMWRTAPNISDPDRKILPDALAFDQRVLLVDDSPIALQVEKRMLEGFGLNVDAAMGGADALEKIRLRDYDLLVTDLEMPCLSGFNLIEKLREEQKYKNLPVLVIATRDGHEDQHRAQQAGANLYLVKQQLNSDNLLSALQSLLGS